MAEIVRIGDTDYRFEYVLPGTKAQRDEVPEGATAAETSVEELAAEGWTLCAGEVWSPARVRAETLYHAAGWMWIHNALFRRKAAVEGSLEEQLGPVTLTCMNPEVRQVMDRSLEEWQLHRAEIQKQTNGEYPIDEVYSYAYWLFRHSGLITIAPKGTA